MKGKCVMKSSTKLLAKICLIISAVLCAALILVQFVPYWTYQNTAEGKEDTISIIEYMAFPSDNTDVTDYFEDNTDSFKINSLAGTFCIVFLLGIASIVFLVIKPNSRWISVWPTAVGLGSLIGYLTEPLWQLGSYYTVLVVLSAILTVAALIPFILWVTSVRYWFIDPKELAK